MLLVGVNRAEMASLMDVMQRTGWTTPLQHGQIGKLPATHRVASARE